MNGERPRVVVTHWVHPEVLAELGSFATVLAPTREQGWWSPERVAEVAAEAEALICCMSDRVDEALLARCPRLRIVSATLKGYDNFDADACARHGVWLTVVPETLIPPTAELAIGLTIALLRRVAEGDALVREGRFAGWRPQLYGTGLAGSDVGILGMGSLGQAIARRLTGFQATVRYHDPRPLDADAERELGAAGCGFDDLVSGSGILILTLPLTAESCRLIDRPLLSRLPRGGFVINVGRGSVVDEEAIADALDAGQLGGYAADVFAMEDAARPDRPAAPPQRLLRHPRTLFTPHLGSAVDAVRLAMSREAVHQVRQVFLGQRPDHPVNLPRA